MVEREVANLVCVPAVLKNPETNPYPHKFHVTYDDSEFEREFNHLKSGETAEHKVIKIAGRIYNKRASGSKLIFYGTLPPPTLEYHYLLLLPKPTY